MQMYFHDCHIVTRAVCGGREGGWEVKRPILRLYWTLSTPHPLANDDHEDDKDDLDHDGDILTTLE